MDVQSHLVSGIQYKTNMNSLKSLDKVLKNADSRAWIKCAMDPFHDTQLDVEGLPDMRVSPSVVQVHTQAHTITCPSGVSSGTFDASIIFSGIDSVIGDAACHMIQTATVGLTSACGTDTGSLVTDYTSFGSLNIWAGPSGNPMETGQLNSNESSTSLGSIKNTDRCRLIAVGIELHDTTADIYKQGSLTVAQLPDVAEDGLMIEYKPTNTATKYYNDRLQIDRGCIQASTLAALQQVPGSKTWKVSEGCYLIPRLVKIQQNLNYLSASNVATNARYGSLATRGAVIYGSDGKSAVPEPIGYNNYNANGGLTAPCFLFTPLGPNSFAPCQIWLSNLNLNSSINVVFRTVVEYFPAVGSVLLPLASPSPNFDPFILALYSEIIKDVPFAVHVNDNASGDLFRNVVRAILHAIEVGSPLMGQYAPLILGASKAVGAGMDFFESLGRKDKPKKLIRA